MIKVELEDETVIINVSEHPELLSGRFSIIFNNLGFKKDMKTNTYVCDDTALIGRKHSEISKFLKRRGYSIENCSNIIKLTAEVKEENEMYNKAKTEGLKVKMSNDTKIALPGFARTLKDYQERAVKHLITIHHGANFSVPGSGKTTMLYATFGYWRNLKEVEKLFVIGPLNSFMAWEDEYIDCFNSEPTCVRLIGPDRAKKYEQTEDVDVFLTSFQTASQDVDRIIDLMKRHKFMVVIDESHYIKRFDNGTWANTVLKVAPYAQRRAISTGTPMPNGLLDMYTQMTFLWPGKQVLGEKLKYKAEVKMNNDIEYFRDKIEPFFYRIKKADLNLPEPKIHYYKIKMSKYQKKIYELLAYGTLDELQSLSTTEIIEVGKWRKAKMIRLMQCATNPGLLSDFCEEFNVPPLSPNDNSIVDIIKSYPKYEKPIKIKKVIELSESLVKSGEKVLIWTTFIRNICILKNELEQLNIPVYLVFGEVPKDDSYNEEFNREQQIRSFKKSKEPCVLLANPAACAESISLHKDCHHAIYLERSFNCGQFLQSKDRIHRIGLEKDQETHYHFFCSLNSIDEVIDERLEEKSISMYELIESDLPIGEVVFDNEQWKSANEQEQDFIAVKNHLETIIKDNN